MKKQANKIQALQKKEIQVLSTIIDRLQLGTRAGYQYGTDRDIYQALGYKQDLKYDDYLNKYARHDIGKAIIKRPVDATWRGGITLLESDDDNETALEKAWKDIYKRFSLHSKFARLDRLSGIGSYGVLLLGLDDVKNNTGFEKPVDGNNRKLLYVKPLGEGSAAIKSWEKNTNNERYGMPEIYDVKIINPGSNKSSQIKVHHTRVIHVAGELMESETEGTPRLKAVYNRLMDLEKLVGGDAEMFWRNARPGFQGVVDKEFQEIDTTGMQDQLDEYTHNLRRFLMLKGIKLESLEQQIADPKSHVYIQLQMICAERGIPIRILIGSERGELASTEDRNNWFEIIQARREEFAEPLIIRAFVDRCIEYGILPKPKDDYTIQWKDLWSPSEKEQAEIGKIKSESLAAYTRDPMNQYIMPPEAFFQFVMNLKDEEIELIEEMRKKEVKEEEDDFGEEVENE